MPFFMKNPAPLFLPQHALLDHCLQVRRHAQNWCQGSSGRLSSMVLNVCARRVQAHHISRAEGGALGGPMAGSGQGIDFIEGQPEGLRVVHGRRDGNTPIRLATKLACRWRG